MAYRQVFGWVAIVTVSVIAAGCGGGGDDSGSNGTTATTTTATTSTAPTSAEDGAAQTLDLGVIPGKFQFDKTKLAATAGKVTLKLTNSESIQHNVAIKDSDGKELAAGELVGDAGVSTVTVDLEPGTYEYVCTPHEALGMKGTLTVS